MFALCFCMPICLSMLCTHLSVLMSLYLLQHQSDNRWYDFDDSHVVPVTEEKVKTSAAYVLFYRRVRSQ